MASLVVSLVVVERAFDIYTEACINNVDFHGDSFDVSALDIAILPSLANANDLVLTQACEIHGMFYKQCATYNTFVILSGSISWSN